MKRDINEYYVNQIANAFTATVKVITISLIKNLYSLEQADDMSFGGKTPNGNHQFHLYYRGLLLKNYKHDKP